MEHVVVNSFFLVRGRAGGALPSGQSDARPGGTLSSWNRPSAPGPRDDAFPFDGVVQTPRCAQAGFADLGPALRETLDLPASIRMDAVQRVVVPGTAPIKLMIFSRKAPHLSSRAYSEYWFGRHKQVVLQQRDFMQFVRGYRQNHVMPESVCTGTEVPTPDRDRFDGVIEQWFDSIDDALRAYQTPGYQIHTRGDEPNFLAVGTSIATFVDELALAPAFSNPPN